LRPRLTKNRRRSGRFARQAVVNFVAFLSQEGKHRDMKTYAVLAAALFAAVAVSACQKEQDSAASAPAAPAAPTASAADQPTAGQAENSAPATESADSQKK